MMGDQPQFTQWNITFGWIKEEVNLIHDGLDEIRDSKAKWQKLEYDFFNLLRRCDTFRVRVFGNDKNRRVNPNVKKIQKEVKKSNIKQPNKYIKEVIDIYKLWLDEQMRELEAYQRPPKGSPFNPHEVKFFEFNIPIVNFPVKFPQSHISSLIIGMLIGGYIVLILL